jgi:tetratricopeptide (TPR) repeat protein
MKRCPECRRDYYDDSLLYCLDDGNALLEGPTIGEAPTAVFGDVAANTRTGLSRRNGILVVLLIGAVAATAGWYWQMTRPMATITPSKTVNDDYIRAKVLMSSENKEDNGEAIRLLEKAVEEDSRFGMGWAALARAYNVKAFYFAKPAERKKLNEDAQVAVEKAFALDSNLAEAHLARGVLLWTHTNRFQHEQAVESYKRALSLDPTLGEAHHQIALVYLHLGLFDRARAEIAKALEINPAHTYARFRYGVIDLYRGRYEDAYAFFKSTPLEKNPSLHAFQTATALLKLGRDDESAAILDRYLISYPEDEGGVGTSVRAMLLAKAGKTQEAEVAIERAEHIGKDFGHFHHTAYNIASAYAILGRKEKAIDYLQMAADDGFPCYPLFENDKVFKPVRDEPRFIALLTKLKQQWERYNASL